MMQEMEKALADFDFVIKHGTNEPGVPFEQARLNKGNMLVMLGGAGLRGGSGFGGGPGFSVIVSKEEP